MGVVIFVYLTMKHALLLFICLAGYAQTFSVHAQTTFERPDSLLSLLEKPLPDTARAALLFQVGRYYFSKDDLMAHRYLLQYLDMAKKMPANKKQLVKTHNYLSFIYTRFGDPSLAMRHSLEAVRISEKQNVTTEIGESYRTLGGAYMHANDYTKARQNINKSLSVARQTSDRALYMRGLTMLADWYMAKSVQRYDSARLVLLQAQAIAFDLKNQDQYLPHILLGLAWAHVSLERYAEAHQYFEEGLALSKKLNRVAVQGFVLCDYGRALIQEKKYKEGEAKLQEALALVDKLGYHDTEAKIYRSLIDLYIIQKNTNMITRMLDRYMDLRDSILNEQRARKIAALEVRFDSEKKEQAIALLERENEIQTLWKYILIGGAAFLLTVLVVIYRLQLARNRKAKELLHAQQALNEKLQENDRLRSRLFANISHEFRTPLSLILAPIEDKIQSPRFTAADKNDFQLIRRNANRLLNLVNQILDLSKLEAGKMKIHPHYENMREWVNILTASFNSFAQTRAIQFNKTIQLDRHAYWFDEDKLEKIITNTLSNAFKYTPTGGVVSFSIQEHNSVLQIVVSDTGKGIPKEDIPYVFSPFYQSRHTADDGQLGTGLGLTMVYELVKLHQGTVFIQSEVNQGTTITITLRLQEGSEATTRSTEPLAPGLILDAPVVIEETTAATEAQSILVVEDNPELRKYIGDIFNQTFQVLYATNGEEGETMAQNELPDIIISDVMMPVKDGLELTESIKSQEQTSHIPVILLTAKSDSTSRIEGLQLGADDYLSKPFSAQELRIRVENMLRQRKKLAEHYRHQVSTLPATEEVKELSMNDKFILKLKACIENNLSNSSYSVEVLADEMCLSRAQLFRKVKAMLDISPSELINDIRLEHAARLIRAKADTLSQISYSVGFNEQSYFAKRFRKKYGMSPSEYAGK